jgi:ABC-type lipoprotein export system ATPase subunit
VEAKTRKIVVIATHDPFFAVAADTMSVLSEGRVVERFPARGMPLDLLVRRLASMDQEAFDPDLLDALREAAQLDQPVVL